MYTLAEWEKYLSEKIAYVELLGELDLSDEQVKSLGKMMAELVRCYGQSETLRILESNYPTALAVYLVAKGIYGYQEGTYWASIAEESSLNAQQRLGQFFEQFLQENNLPSFLNVGGYRYVTIILLHGGIPNYCLQDFFEHFLHPALSRPDLIGFSAKDLIAERLFSSSRSDFVDKPIHRFLKYGSNLARDFVARCFTMGQHYIEHETFLPEGEIGLPYRVIEAYRVWATEQARATSTHPSRLRLIRPTVVLDPWGNGLIIDLPTQTIPHTLNSTGSKWTIQADQVTLDYPVHAHWRNVGWETESYQIELSHPAP